MQRRRGGDGAGISWTGAICVYTSKRERQEEREAGLVLAAFETLLTLGILARRARLTPLCAVENDDITIKLPSAYGN